MNRNRSIAWAALLLFTLAACHHSQQQKRVKPQVDPELLKISKEEAFKRGDDALAKKKFIKARVYYSYLYENNPNDPIGRRSLLRVADTYYSQGDPINLVEAQYKYRDFINRYPGSEYADYAMLQIGMVSYKQMLRPDRDQTKTHETVEKLNDMIKAYPKSTHRAEADKHLQEAIDRLAAHEHVVARFYMKRRDFNAAVLRLNNIVEKYPDYSQRDGTFFDLGTSLTALGRKGEARLYYERVISEFPSSLYTKQAKDLLDKIKA